MEKQVFFTSLGCSKNLVDSQVMLGHFGLAGFSFTEDPAVAHVIVINTCSFIQAAKEESIETIFELSRHKKGSCEALVVAGCLAQRYGQELEREIPEIDLILGTGEYHRIVQLLKAMEEGKLEVKSHIDVPKFIHTEYDPRINTSPPYMAWLKVSEGCNRNCTFCIIPSLRGKLRSRSVRSLSQEAEGLVQKGVREINIISQDLSDYGVDLNEENTLVKLLQELEGIKGLDWIRLFYFYPDELTDEMIDVMSRARSLCRYLDSPVQHFSSGILRKMNRRITGQDIRQRISRLRERIPGIILRTSVIVGFPGETEEDFQELLDGIRETRFHHVGVFRYSDEEGTPAFRLKNKVSSELIEERFSRVYQVQKEIAKELNEEFLGQRLEVLIEGQHKESKNLIVGRHQGQAPDIDGQVIINKNHGLPLRRGDMVPVRITDVLDFDLLGETLPERASL